MNKDLTPLEALEKLWQGAINPYEYLLDDEPNNIVLKETIEKSLKTLEIIKKHIVIGYDEEAKLLIIYAKIDDKNLRVIYVTDNKEEYDLLKEVLV